MLSPDLLEKIEKIDKNLNTNFEQEYIEKVFARSMKLSEEVGELISEILKKFYKKREQSFDETNLKQEFADVILTTLLLAKSLDIDINECLAMKLKKIEERGGF